MAILAEQGQKNRNREDPAERQHVGRIEQMTEARSFCWPKAEAAGFVEAGAMANRISVTQAMFKAILRSRPATGALTRARIATTPS